MKKGISLMVLVIIIIVMIILATAIVITITNANSLDKANGVTKENDIDKVQLMAELGLNEILKENNGNLSGVNVEEKLNSYLEDKNVDLNKYNIVYVAGSSSKNGTVTVSEITYIPIYTEEDLALIGCDDEKELSDGKTYDMLNTYYYKLMNDITITKEFTPISRLNGRLYGNGKKIILSANYAIAECVIDFMEDSFFAASLISVIGENGIVRDLGMEGTLDMSAVNTSATIATIAGINIGTIDNCYSTVNITAGTENSEFGAFIGGLVAINANTIINSYNAGNITSHSHFMGGLAGVSYNIRSSFYSDRNPDEVLTTSMITKSITTKIIESYNSGKILSTTKLGSDNKVGGLVGQAISTKISSCYNSGDVTNENIAGGIAGTLDYFSSVKDCYNKGKISNYSNSLESFIAGIVGQCTQDSTIYNCYNIGTIQATIQATSTDGDIRQIAANQQDISACISKCYYLYSAGVEDDYATGVSDVYMKSTSFINTLNSNSTGAWTAVTSDYPKLSWE